MSISARKFLDRLAERGLLEENVVNEFRTHVEQSLFEVPCEALAKLLVDKGHLTSFQASKLLAEVAGGAAGGGEAAPDAGAAKKPAAPPPAAKKPAPPPAAQDSDDLDLADLGDGGPMGTASKPAASKPAATKPTPPKPTPPSKPPGGLPSGTAADAKRKSAKSDSPGTEEIVLLEDADEAAPAAKKPTAPPATKSSPPPAAKSPQPGKAAAPAAGRPDRAAGKPAQPRREAAPAPLAPLDDAGLAPLTDQGLAPLSDLTGGFDAGLGGAAPGADPFAAGGLATAQQPATLPTAGIKKSRAKGFQSTWFLVAVGLVISLIIATPFIYFNLMRGTASDMFAAAETDYKASSYTQAIAKYDKFLKEYPADPNASLARVRRGLAKIRSVTEGAKDARQALTAAQEVLPEIAVEDRFADARPELTGILPTIASTLAKQARDAGSGKAAKDLVKLAEEAMELVMDSNNIPSQLRAPVQSTIDEIGRMITEANRSIRQAEQLVEALAKMEKALAENKTNEAFEIRRVLLREFPGLEFHEQLVALVLKVAAAERDQVQVTAQEIAAATDDYPRAAELRAVILAHRRGDPVEGAAGQIAFVLGRGSVYGIDVGTGKVLWRRFVGFETFIHPQPVAKQPGADVLVADTLHQEIARLEAKTGKLVWRLPIGERFASPVIWGERVFVTTLSGRVLDADLASGKSARSAKLPQGTTVEIGGSAQLPNAYQAGAHSNLYVLATDSLACKEAFYLGHRAGTIAVPPVAVLNHVFVAENAGTDYSLIHIVATDETGLKLERPADQEPIRLTGNVVSPLIQVKNRIIVTTDRAALVVLEVDTSNKRKPVKTIAARVAAETQPLPSQVLADGAQLWIGNDRLVALDIQASREQLAPKWVKHELEWFVAPLQKFGSTMMHVRRRRGSPGLTVSAFKPDSGNLIWQTDLGVPLTYLGHEAEKNQVVAISAQGELYRLSKEALDAGYLDQPVETAEVAGSATTFAFTEAGKLDENRTLLVSDVEPNSALLFDPRRVGDELAVLRLDAGGTPLNSTPVPFAGGLAVTTETAVQWLSADSGKSAGLPFQPKLGPGETIRWNRPAVLPGGRELVACDGRQRIYRVAVQPQPNPHLAVAAEGAVAEPLLGSLAACGTAAIGWSRGGSSDVVRVFPLPGLGEAQEIVLQGRVLQGPWSTADAVYLVSDKEGLIAMAGGPQAKWLAPLTDGPLAGPPQRVGDSLLVATLKGTLLRLSAETGEVKGKLELNEPLYGSPQALGDRWLVPGADGVLYVAPGVP